MSRPPARRTVVALGFSWSGGSPPLTPPCRTRLFQLFAAARSVAYAGKRCLPHDVAANPLTPELERMRMGSPDILIFT
jgi:hypothetical protein